MKIYTKTGDDGSTGLIGGSRIRKSDRRIECYGTVDELNASIGLALVAIADESLRAGLLAIQNDLFVIGSHLAVADATPVEKTQWLPAIDEAMVSRLEMQIDTADEKLPALKTFILPGGGEAAGRLHVARTVCRRAERLIVDFAFERPVPAVLLTYLNRLSDWLFVHARLANQIDGIADVPWHP